MKSWIIVDAYGVPSVYVCDKKLGKIKTFYKVSVRKIQSKRALIATF